MEQRIIFFDIDGTITALGASVFHPLGGHGTGQGQGTQKWRSAPVGPMTTYSAEELLEDRRSIASTLSKWEKALLKLIPGKSQLTPTARRIAAFRIALDLIGREFEPYKEEQP